MSNNIYDIMNKLNAVASKDTPQVKSESGSRTLLESTMKEVLNEKYMGFDKTAAAQGKKLGERRLSERMPIGSVPAPELGPLSYKPADQTDDDVADIPMPGNKLSPKDQYRAIKKDVEHVQQGRRGLKPGFNLEKDSDVGRFAVPGYGDQGQFFQEDDMEEGNLFTGNLAKARAQGKKRADLDGDGDMETVREGTKPDYIDLDKDGNRKESMKKAAADKKKSGVKGGYPYGQHKPKKGECPECGTVGGHEDDCSRHYDNKKKGVAEGTKETSTGRVHKADPGGYGRRDDEDEDGKKKTEPAVKRGRGRPKKNADGETGEVKKYDNAAALQSFMVGNLPKGKLPGKTTTKHKIKDEPDEKLDEKAPPGAKAERMVKHIKHGYAKDGNLTDKEKGIAYATAWKAKKAGKVEESIPPGFPRSLAKKIYEHFDGDVDHTLDVMWKIHNTVMESQSLGKKKLSESMAFEQSTTKPTMGSYRGGIWTADPPKPGQKGVPPPMPDEGPTAPVKAASVKKAPTTQSTMGTIKGGVWTADPPKPGQVGVPVPQDIDGGSAPAPKSKPVKTQKKAEVDVDGDTGLAEMLNLAGIKAAVTEADLSECGMSSSPISGAMNDDDGRMNISTNMSSDGNKSVTITADGEAAVELMKMLKMAGMNANMGHEDTDVETMSEEKDPRYEASTTPEEEVLPVQTQLKGGNGDVAGKEKKMTPHGYKFADNPLAMKESMSLKLIKEYEGIKKAV